MGKLTIDIPDGTHHDIRVLATSLGLTIKEFILDRLEPDLELRAQAKPSLGDLGAKWKESRKNLRLERGERSFAEVIHEGHRW